MNLLLYGFVALAIMAAVGTGVYKVKKWGADEVRAEWSAANDKARAEEAAKGDAAAKGLEADREKTKTIFRTITKAVDRIVDRPIYRSVCLDADGLRLARCAIDGKSADSCKPDSPVPVPTKPSGRHRGLSLTMDTGSLRNVP